MRLLVIANPAAGRGRSLRALQRYLAESPSARQSVELVVTCRAGYAADVARAALRDPPEVLAVCGGDGTLNEVVSAVPEPPFPVGIIPGGTANVLARELGQPLDPVAALENLLRPAVWRVDLGCLEGQGTRRFLLMAGIGFDAWVVGAVDARAKRTIGIGAYYIAAISGLARYPFPRFRVSVESETWTASSCVVANARSYGGNLAVNPGADMADGLLDVLVLGPASRADYFRMLGASRAGRAPDFPWVSRRRARSVTLEGGGNVPVQVDGEPAGTLPARIGLTPSSFPLAVPRSHRLAQHLEGLNHRQGTIPSKAQIHH